MYPSPWEVQRGSAFTQTCKYMHARPTSVKQWKEDHQPNWREEQPPWWRGPLGEKKKLTCLKKETKSGLGSCTIHLLWLRTRTLVVQHFFFFWFLFFPSVLNDEGIDAGSVCLFFFFFSLSHRPLLLLTVYFLGGFVLVYYGLSPRKGPCDGKFLICTFLVKAAAVMFQQSSGLAHKHRTHADRRIRSYRSTVGRPSPAGHLVVVLNI